MQADAADRSGHRTFLNRYYGWSRGTYDLTRRYYLFGRDTVLDALASEEWSTLVEMGPGTGRNLSILHRLRPDARLGGVEACDAMLDLARRKCSFAALMQGFAEDADLERVHGVRPDRILFSYCLSMVQDPEAALRNATRSVAPGGRVVVVDFGDGMGLPGPARRALHRWLRSFHVSPLRTDLFGVRGATLRFGPGRYWLAASLDGAAR